MRGISSSRQRCSHSVDIGRGPIPYKIGVDLRKSTWLGTVKGKHLKKDIEKKILISFEKRPDAACSIYDTFCTVGWHITPAWFDKLMDLFELNL